MLVSNIFLINLIFSFLNFRCCGLQPRNRGREHEGANAVGHGQEGARHQASLRALRTRIGWKMRELVKCHWIAMYKRFPSL